MATPDPGKIYGSLLSAGLPVTAVLLDDGIIDDRYSRTLTAPERTQADAIIDDPQNLHRKPRSLHEIYQDVDLLSGANKQSIWNDLSSGTPKKFVLDTGPNCSSIMVLQWAIESSNTGSTSVQEAQLRLIVMYVQDNPRYLVNPPFSPTINVPGDEPVS